jgi:CrcB protein
MDKLSQLGAIGAAGAVGALARYAVVEWTARWWRGRFPFATFLINITGAFALGLLLTAGGGQSTATAQWKAVLGAGLLGGYTTFSTLSYETHVLARRGHRAHAWLNAAGTLMAGAAAAAAGIILGRAL